MTLGGVETRMNPGSLGKIEFSRTISRGADFVPDKTINIKKCTNKRVCLVDW